MILFVFLLLSLGTNVLLIMTMVADEKRRVAQAAWEKERQDKENFDKEDHFQRLFRNR